MSAYPSWQRSILFCCCCPQQNTYAHDEELERRGGGGRGRWNERHTHRNGDACEPSSQWRPTDDWRRWRLAVAAPEVAPAPDPPWTPSAPPPLSSPTIHLTLSHVHWRDHQISKRMISNVLSRTVCVSNLSCGNYENLHIVQICMSDSFPIAVNLWCGCALKNNHSVAYQLFKMA